MPTFYAKTFYDEQVPQLNRMRSILWCGAGFTPLAADGILDWFKSEITFSRAFLERKLICFEDAETVLDNSPAERSFLFYFSLLDSTKVLYTVFRVLTRNVKEPVWLTIIGRDRLAAFMQKLDSNPNTAHEAAQRIEQFADRELLSSNRLQDLFEATAAAVATLEAMRLHPYASDQTVATLFAQTLLVRCEYAVQRLPSYDYSENYAVA